GDAFGALCLAAVALALAAARRGKSAIDRDDTTRGSTCPDSGIGLPRTCAAGPYTAHGVAPRAGMPLASHAARGPFRVPAAREEGARAAAALCPVLRKLADLHERFQPLAGGTVATYIPELARSDPAWFGISVATADGHVYEVGDARQPFTIQSISK